MCLHGSHGGGQRGSVDSAQRWCHVPDEPSGTRGAQTPGPCRRMQRSDLHPARGVRPDRSSGSSSRAAERKSTTSAVRVPVGTLRSSTHRRFEPPRGNSRPLISRMHRVRRRSKRRFKSCQPDRCLALSEAHWSLFSGSCISIASLSSGCPPRRGRAQEHKHVQSVLSHPPASGPTSVINGGLSRFPRWSTTVSSRPAGG